MADAPGAPDTILVSRDPGETRYALLAGDDVIEVAFSRDGEFSPGAVVAGRVVGVLAGTAFIDIGDDMPGVLRVKTPLTQGQTIAVRLIVPARTGKGAELKRAEDVPLPEGIKTATVISSAPDMAQTWWMRYGGSVTRVVCAPMPELHRMQALLGADAPIEVHTGGADLFEAFGVEEAIEAGLESIIALPCGGAVTIETTAGAMVIDIDAGPALPMTANAEAIDVISRALRLRNIGGHILIDVIPPARGRRTAVRAAAQDLADRLAGLMAADPVTSEVAGVTPLGMIELTRRRVGLSLSELLTAGDRHAASQAYMALRRAVRIAHQAKTARVVVAADVDVVALLQGRLLPALKEAIECSKVAITLRERPGAVDVSPA